MGRCITDEPPMGRVEEFEMEWEWELSDGGKLE